MHALLVVNLIGYLVEEKYKNKDFACFYENLTNSEASSESRILFFCTGFPLHHWSIFSRVHSLFNAKKYA
jgi:hypothetical protein